MKLTIILIIAFLALSSCHITSKEDAKKGVAAFYEGFFSYYNLSSPSQIISCFDDKNAELYIASLYAKFELLRDTTDRKSLIVHLEYGKLWLLDHALESTYNCLSFTQDFTDLLDAQNVTDRNPEHFKSVAYLMYQAHYDDLYEAYKPIIDYLNSNNFTKAGRAYGSAMSYSIKTVKKEGLSRLAFNAFRNGESVRLDLDEPSDSLECFDKNASALNIHFFYRLAVTVTEGKISDSYENAINFLENEGLDIMRQIPDEVMECDRASDDYDALRQKLGIDIYTPEFGELMRNYASHHHWAIYADLKGLRSAIENHNFVHAGAIYGHFLSTVASKK